MDECKESEATVCESGNTEHDHAAPDVLSNSVEEEDNGGAKASSVPSDGECDVFAPTGRAESQGKPGLKKTKRVRTKAKERNQGQAIESLITPEAIHMIIHERMISIHEGMVITMGYLHCIMSLNVMAGLCLTVFLWLKTTNTPKFIIMFFFTLLAVLYPSVITEVTLLMLEPPLDICENLSDYFRNTAKLANKKIGISIGKPEKKKQ